MKIWFPTIRAGSGSDVFTERLATALTRRGIRAEITWLPHHAEYAPWTVAVPKPPVWANVVHINSWLHTRFIPTGLPLVVTVHGCVHDPALEPHYRLPLLSVIPKPAAHVYLKLLGRGDFYYENHLSHWDLKRLVSAFVVEDYTLKVIAAPEKYHAEDVLTPGSRKQLIALAVLRARYWLCPTYLWVLRKIN